MILESGDGAIRLTCSALTMILEPKGGAMKLTCFAVTMILDPGVELWDSPVQL